MKLLQELSLKDLAPPSIISDKIISNLLSTLSIELMQVSGEIPEALIYSRLDTLPECILDLLAWQWHVDFYDLARNVDMKRAMIKDSIKVHRHKGTKYAIIKAMEMLGIESRFVAWYEDKQVTADWLGEPFTPEPYTFAIEAKLTGDFWERVDWTKPTQTIRRAILESKAARSHMTKIFIWFENDTSCNIHFGQAFTAGGLYRVPVKPPERDNAIFSLRVASPAITCAFYKIKHNAADKDYFIQQDLFSKQTFTRSVQQNINHGFINRNYSINHDIHSRGTIATSIQQIIY